MIDRDIQLIHDLEVEFVRLAGEPDPRRVRVRSRRVAIALALLCLALAGVAAAQVSGLIDVTGDETSGLSGLGERRAVAHGVTADGREWLLSAGTSGTHLCVALRVSADETVNTATNCGGMERGRLGAAVVPGAPAALVFGLVPETAASVRVRSSGGTESADVRGSGDEAVGKFFVIPVDESDMSTARLQAVDAGGAAVAPAVALTDLLARSSATSRPPGR